jgi:FtsH-binding integral membrane protein
MSYLQITAAWFFGLSLSAWLGRVDLHSDDTGILLGLIGLGGFLLAMVEPRRPLTWGIIVPAGVILVEVWRGAEHLGSVLAIAAVTVATASLGSYLGSRIRRLAANA